MDRTDKPGALDVKGRKANRPPRKFVAAGAQPMDPFKERLERGIGRKRGERHDPRIARPGSDSARMEAAARAAAAASISTFAAPVFPRQGPPPPPREPLAERADPIIPPGEVFADTDPVTELVQHGDSDFILAPDPQNNPPPKPQDEPGFKSAPVAAAAAAATSSARPGKTPAIQPMSGPVVRNEPPAQRTVDPGSARKETPAARDGQAKHAGGEHQDDVATGAIAALMMLVAGWVGFNALTDRSPAPLAPENDANVSIASAPVAAPDPFAGAPVDLTPKAVPGDGNESIFAPAAAALDPMPLSPAILMPVAFATSFTALAAPVSEAAPEVAVSCDPNMIVRSYFCTAKTGMTPASKALLDKELANLKACASGRELVVTGFADTRGVSTMNSGLSAGRAESVATYLRSQGLAVTTVAGVGELSDIEDGKNCANQRRVDIAVKGSAPPASRACTPPPAAAALVCG